MNVISNRDKALSIVIPTFNEEDNIEVLYRRLITTINGIGINYEIIFSVDPCTDHTEDIVLGLREKDKNVKMLRFSRRFGQPSATLAGLNYANGDATVVIDCDLQDPPELISEMVDRWDDGYEVVFAQRSSRKGETLLKRLVSVIGYRVINRASDVDMPKNTGDYRLMSRRVVNEVVKLSESHGFLRGLVAAVGFKQTSVKYERDPRQGGEGKYNQFIGSLLIGMNGLVGFSRYPLHVISIVGFLLAIFAFLLGLAYGILQLVAVPFPTGNPTIVVVVCFFSGIQLLSLGIIGEYIGRIYEEVKNRPLYIVEDAYGFSDESE